MEVMERNKTPRRPPPKPRRRLPMVRTDRPEGGDGPRPEGALVKRAGGELVPTPDQALTPRQRLQAVAKGDAPLDHKDIEALLTDLVLDADQRSRSLARRCGTLVAMVFDSESRKIMDPTAAMDLMMRLDRVQRNHQADMRRGIELLSKITRPNRPMVQVVASTSQLNVAAQQVVGGTDLGGRGDEC